MKKTFRQYIVNGCTFDFLDLPGSNIFKFEIVSKKGASIERVLEKELDIDFYGISHLIEHLSFKSTKDHSTDNVNSIMRNYGLNNASTGHEEIYYWFTTISTYSDIAINLICNVAFNNLHKVTQKEFDIEKNIVSNEVKSYLDDNEDAFYYGARGKIYGLYGHDNVLGDPDIISKFTLADVIKAKAYFLNIENYKFNVTFDSSTGMIPNDIISTIMSEISKFDLYDKNDNIDFLYHDRLGKTHHGNFKLNNISDKRLYYGLFDTVNDPITSNLVSEYISELSGKTSLSELIREQNGLSYFVGMNETITAGRYQTEFICDITKGNENKMLELFQASLNDTANSFNEEKHKKFQDSVLIQRILENVDLNNYDKLFTYSLWNPIGFAKYRDLLYDDIDHAFVQMDIISGSYQNMKSQLEYMKIAVNDKRYAMVTN